MMWYYDTSFFRHAQDFSCDIGTVGVNSRPSHALQKKISMNLNVLEDILDPGMQNFDDILFWVNERIRALRQTVYSEELTQTLIPVELKEKFSHPFGVEASPVWRRFFLAALVADWACYDNETNRADFARLKYVMTDAYRTTRLWFCKLADGTHAPVGYTAWYPIAKFVFEGAINATPDIADRGIFMPLRFVEPEDARYAYVFNISIIKELIGTPCSRKLALALEREDRPHLGAIAVAVGKQGHEFLKRMRFAAVKDIYVRGEKETLYARLPA